MPGRACPFIQHDETETFGLMAKAEEFLEKEKTFAARRQFIFHFWNVR